MVLEILYDGKRDENNEAEIDIIAVHGLNPQNKPDHAHQTWLKNDHLWLRDSLPKSLPTARVMLYKYNSSPVFGSDRKPFIAEATSLLTSSWVRRKDCLTRPLLLIGHSLGGILIKQAIVNAHMDDKHKNLRESIFAVVFMGTPHYGSTNDSKVIFGKAFAKIVQTTTHRVPNGLLKALEDDSTFSDILRDQWRSRSESYHFISCYGAYDKIVPYESARMNLSDSRETAIKRSADHSDVCRFDPAIEADAEEYEEFIENMKSLCEKALSEEKMKSDLVSSSLANEIIETLKPLGQNPRYARIDVQHEDSLQWIWSEDATGPQFIKWLQSEGRLMWISGKPGAGKSTLMKYIHEQDETLEILRSFTQTRVELISYFLHDLGSPTECTFSGLLHALLCQTLSLFPELAAAIHQRFRKLRIRSIATLQDSSIWSEVELQAAFRDILKAQSERVTILCMIDALDECETKQLHPLLRFINGLVGLNNKGGNMTFKFICSSRRENAIELAFIKHPSFRIEHYTSKDIEKFITARLAEVTVNLYPDEKSDRIIAEVVEAAVCKAEGVFIWAILVADELIVSIEAGEILELPQKLGELPADLEELYARIIERIPLEVRHHTHNYLQILGYGFGYIKKGPENLLGMMLAMQPIDGVLTAPPWALTDEEKVSSCITAKRLLQDRCRGLINVPSYQIGWTQERMLNSFCKGEVFIHKTVQDYLFKTDSSEGKVVPLVGREVWSGIDPKLLNDHIEQHAAFTFRLLQVDSKTRKDAVPDSIWGNRKASHFLVCFTHLLGLIAFAEKPSVLARSGKEPLAPLWVPAIENFIHTIASSNEEIQDFYDAITCPLYVDLERCAEDPALEPFHSDLLSIAMWYGIRSYVLPRLSELDVPKPGRPYLHYTMDERLDYSDFCQFGPLLLQQGHRLDQVFNGRTTWEYFLISMAYKLGEGEIRRRLWDINEYDKLIILLLEYGADVNLEVDMHDYACSVLHLILADQGPPYEKVERVLLALLDRGADVNVRDSNGVSVLEMAEKNWPDAVDLLREYSSWQSFGNSDIKERQVMLKGKRGVKECRLKESVIQRIENIESNWGLFESQMRPVRVEKVEGC